MIIRSQDKKRITSELDLYIVHITIYEQELWCIKSSMAFIGEYSTEEKAIKVLDMIQSAYGKSFEEERNNYIGHRYNVVFQMPQDSEV